MTETITAVTLTKTITNGYPNLLTTMTTTGSIPANADPSKTQLSFSIGLAYDDTTDSSAFKTKFGALWRDNDNYINNAGELQAPRFRWDSIESYNSTREIGSSRSNVSLALDKPSLLSGLLDEHGAYARVDGVFDPELVYLDSAFGYSAAKSTYGSTFNALTDAEKNLWKRQVSNKYGDADTVFSNIRPGEATIDEWGSWVYAESFLGTGASGGSEGYVQLDYFKANGDYAGGRSNVFNFVAQDGNIIYSSDNPGSFINPNSLPANIVTNPTGDLPSTNTPLSLSELKSATASSVATQLMDEFDMTYAGGNTCPVDTFTNITDNQTKMLKRRYTALAATGGDSDAQTLRQNALDAFTVNEHAIVSNTVIGTNLTAYSTGLKQYHISVSNNNFSSITGNSVLNGIVDNLKFQLQQLLINADHGIKAASITSVNTSRGNNNSPAITNQTSTKNCLQALITESNTININRPAGVYGGADVPAVINDLQSVSDGGEHVHTMLSSLSTTGTATINSMIHVNGSNIYIGVRRLVKADNNDDASGNQITVANSITDKIKDTTCGAIRIALLNSEL